VTPEQIEALGKAAVGIIAGFGAIVATVTSAVAAFYTWKNRYELDKLYASTYRPNADGTPGPMRQHPKAIVNLFQRKDPKEPPHDPSAASGEDPERRDAQ